MLYFGLRSADFRLKGNLKGGRMAGSFSEGIFMRFDGTTKRPLLALGAVVIVGVVLYSMLGTSTAKQRSIAKAIRQLAENGDADAQNALGGAYYIGDVSPFRVGQDDKKAVKWWTKAAEQGNDFAQCGLGHMYSKGRGVVQDYNEAARWYTKAAEQGRVVLAQSALGLMYAKGQGVPQDYVEAYKWLMLAAAHGSTKDANEMDVIRQKLSPEQLAEAEKRAREFKPKTADDK
jgi:hypothetical protein